MVHRFTLLTYRVDLQEQRWILASAPYIYLAQGGRTFNENGKFLAGRPPVLLILFKRTDNDIK